MISEYLGFDSDYIILGLAGVVIILLILIITNMVQIGKLKKRYKVFMSGKTAKSLEEMRMLKDEQEELDSRSPEAEAIVPAVTPADLLNVGDVLLNLDGAGSDEDKSYRAAMTLRAIRETDMFELFSSQVENKKLIEELMERYVDEEGNALPLKKERNVSKPVADWRKLV